MQNFKQDLGSWWHDYTRRCGNFTLNEIYSEVESEIRVGLSTEHLKDFLNFMSSRGWLVETVAEREYTYRMGH
jgi:hypothetical protein